MNELYERIKCVCKERGVSVSKMCTDIGISKSTLSSLKNGGTKSLSAPIMKKISDYLEVSVDWLMGYTDTRTYIVQKPPSIHVPLTVADENEKKPPAETDEELDELLERARDDPHIRMLFSVTKDATAEDIEKAIKIIQMLKGE